MCSRERVPRTFPNMDVEYGDALCAWALSFELPWHACWVLQLSMVMTPEIVKTLKIKSINERIIQGNQTGFVPCFLLCVLFSPEQSCVYWVVPVSLLVQAKS